MAHQNDKNYSRVTLQKNQSRTISQDQEPADDKKKSGYAWVWLGLFFILMMITIVIVLWQRDKSRKNLQTVTEQMALPSVRVVKPEEGDPHLKLTLPGTVQSLMQSSVYAQVSGYVKDWLVDIGGQVQKGQLLVDIETPVTDQQLMQAGESIKQAQANLDLAKTTADRYNALLATDAVSQQDVDNQNANVKVQEANLSAAQAFEEGIKRTESFKQVRAPFDGIITARRIDVGDFVSATGQISSNSTGNGPTQVGAPNQELFRIAQLKTLRVYVNVPEQYGDQIAPDSTASMELASSPDRTVLGKVVRNANAIDPSSLTLLMEIDVDNADESLLPGGYAKVHFDVLEKQTPLVIPGNSMLFRQQGPQVGVVDGSNVVHLQSIKIGRDLGTKLEVIDGIQADDSIIINPFDSLTDGEKVNVIRDSGTTQDNSAPKQ